MTKLRLISAALISALLVCAVCVGAGAAISGTGTQADPYKLSSQADLALLSGANYASYAGTGKYFELANDITMTGTFEPIGTSTYKFNGKFDGKGFTIAGLTMSDNTVGHRAMFAYATAGATISNLNFENANIKGKDYTAVLYGEGVGATTSNPVTVTNVNVRNSIVDSSGIDVGGLSGFGAASGSVCVISNCQVIKSTIKSSGTYVGGLSGCGAHSGGKCTIQNCIVDSCQVRSTSGISVGGLSGYGADSGASFFTAIDCQVKNCIVQTSGNHVGGLSGRGASSGASRAEFVRCSAENCYVQGSNHVGGIAGYGTYGAASVTCQFTDCSVDKCTIRATSDFAGGIYGSYRNNGAQPIVSGCDVSDSSILASSNAGGVTGGYSAS